MKYSDEELFRIYKYNGERQKQIAFDALYLRYAKPLIHFFYLQLYHDLEKARDFFHDLFLKILEGPDIFDDKQYFKPWVYRVASNMCKNEYRNQAVHHRFLNNTVIYNAESVNLEGDLKEINRCLKELDPHHRELLILRFKLELSVKELAELFQCPEGTVKSRLFYATKELSKKYKNL